MEGYIFEKCFTVKNVWDGLMVLRKYRKHQARSQYFEINSKQRDIYICRNYFMINLHDTYVAGLGFELATQNGH